MITCTSETASHCPLLTTTCQFLNAELLQSLDTRAQARLVARRRVLVEHTLLDGLIQGRNGLAIHLLGGSFVAFGEALAELAQAAAQARSVGPVAGGASFCLTGALQR